MDSVELIGGTSSSSSLETQRKNALVTRLMVLTRLMSMGGGTSAVAPEETNDGRTTSAHSNRKKKTICCCFTYNTLLGAMTLFENFGNMTFSWKKELHKTLTSKIRRRYSIEDDDKKTLKDEAKSWAHNFERMLKHQVGQKVFQEFLQGQFSDENLRFWIEAENYREMTDENRQKRAKSLYDDFVSTISPCEVSLDAQHRQQIEKNLPDAPKNLFKPAQDYIYRLMYRDCFPRFLRSKTYKRLCR